MDYLIRPQIFETLREDLSPVSRRLEDISGLLELSYRYLSHPILIEWDDYELLNPFSSANNDELYRRLSRTVIERTIHQSLFYINSIFGKKVVVQSKSIELNIESLESFITVANKAYYEEGIESFMFNSNIHLFRITSLGRLMGGTRYFLSLCNQLLLTIRIQELKDKLSNTLEKERMKLLLRKRTNLYHERDQWIKEDYEKFLEYINYEIDYYYTLDSNVSLDYINKLVDQSLATQMKAISNNKLLGLLVANDLEGFCENLREITQGLSYHDISGKEQEKVYHVFLLGLFNDFKEVYEVISNRESGYGRFDILLMPRDRQMKGIIFEVKYLSKVENGTILNILSEAMNQIDGQEYYYDLKQRGHIEYIAVALGFNGKRLFFQYKQCEIR